MIIASIFDKKAKDFTNIASFSNADVCKRTTLATLNGRNLLTEFPHDFAMYQLGELDEETGKVTSCVPFILFEFVDLIPKEETNGI